MRHVLCGARMGVGLTKILLTVLDQHFYDLLRPAHGIIINN